MEGGHVIKQPSDEHMHMIAQQHIKCCQTTMKVPIDKAHSRLDETNKRLARLDDTETGKVTIMWNAKEETRKLIKGAVIGGLVTFFVAQMIGWAGAIYVSHSAIEAAVKKATVETHE